MAKLIPDADKFGTAFSEASKPGTTDLLGSGLARNAADAMKNRPYQVYVRESESMGETPMSIDNFMKTKNK